MAKRTGINGYDICFNALQSVKRVYTTVECGRDNFGGWTMTRINVHNGQQFAQNDGLQCLGAMWFGPLQPLITF